MTPESTQARLDEISRIVAAAAKMIGDEERAIVWFRHQRLTGFGGKTAEELVGEGHASAVWTHLEMLADGVYG